MSEAFSRNCHQMRRLLRGQSQGNPGCRHRKLNAWSQHQWSIGRRGPYMRDIGVCLLRAEAAYPYIVRNREVRIRSPFSLTTLCLALLAPAAKSVLYYFNTTPARRSLLAKQTLYGYSIEIREAQLVVAGGVWDGFYLEVNL